MAVGSICTRRTVTVDVGIDVAAAAQVMRENNIGYLIVTDTASGGRAPIAGVLSIDDVIDHLVLQLSDVAKVAHNETQARQRSRA